MKVAVIGGNPSGLSAASAIRRAYSDWEINVYEKAQYIVMMPVEYLIMFLMRLRV